MLDLIIATLETIDYLWTIPVAATLPNIIVAIRMPKEDLVKWKTKKRS
jgi:hypothetical protein